MRKFLSRFLVAGAVMDALGLVLIPAPALGASSVITDRATLVQSAATSTPFCLYFNSAGSGTTFWYGFSINDPGSPQSLVSLNWSRDNASNITFTTSTSSADLPVWANQKSDGTNNDCLVDASHSYVWKLQK